MSRLQNLSYDQLIADLAHRGFAILPDFLSAAESEALATEARSLMATGDFKFAGVGQGQDNFTDSSVRRDQTLWFDPKELLPAQKKLWHSLTEMMGELNQSLYLGLWDLEGHFAHYGPGAFYKRHLDRFRADDLRTVSCVLYFNNHWQPGDGGELKIYLPSDPTTGESATTQLIEPRGGVLVCFLSDKIEHEVLKSNTDRLSFAGWFRRRGYASPL